MTRSLEPGRYYFDVFTLEYEPSAIDVPYSEAVELLAGGARDVADVTIADEVISSSGFSTHPQLASAVAEGDSIRINLTTDTGETPYKPPNVYFVVEVVSPGLPDVYFSYSEYDQSIFLSYGDPGDQYLISSIRVWALGGGPPPEPSTVFWDGLLGVKEIV